MLKKCFVTLLVVLIALLLNPLSEVHAQQGRTTNPTPAPTPSPTTTPAPDPEADAARRASEREASEARDAKLNEDAEKPLPLDPGIFNYGNRNALPTLGIETLGDDATNPTAVVDSVLINYVINPIFFISAGVAIIVVMYSAFRIITARGEEEGITAAKNTLIWAFAGLALIMLSYTIVRNVAQIIAGTI